MAMITGKDPGEFTLISEGKHIFKITNPEYVPNDGNKPPYRFGMKVEGGEYDGVPYSQNFFLKSKFGDGLDGYRTLLHFGNMAGVLPKEMEHTKLDDEAFAKSFCAKMQDRLVGITIYHSKEGDKTWARGKGFFVANEKKAEGKPSTEEFDEF